jgi:hypothetical protein
MAILSKLNKPFYAHTYGRSAEISFKYLQSSILLSFLNIVIFGTPGIVLPIS